MRNTLRSFLVFVALLAAGCGGGGQGPVGHSDLVPPTRIPVVVARLYLGGDVPGATLQLVGLDGRVLATGVTNRNGMVYFENLTAPLDFRAVATLPGFQRDFRAELRGFDQANRQVRISPLTDLVSRYMEKHPDAALREAESRIKVAVQVPEAVSVGIGLDEPNPVFSDLALLRAAGQNGGWVAYSARVVEQAESGGGRHYFMSVDQLDRPLGGLESGLLPVAEACRVRLQRRLGIPDASPERLAVTLPQPFTLVGGAEGLGGQVLFRIGTGVASNLIASGVKVVFGWAANQLGLNFGTSGQLAEINSELMQLTAMIQGLETALEDASLKQQVQALYDLLAPVRTANGNLQTSLDNANITNQPFAPPPDFAALVDAINAIDYPTLLSQVHVALYGSTQILLKAQTIVLNQLNGLDQPANMQGCPWRANQLIDDVDKLYQFFAGQQTQALNLYAEESHNYLLNPNPVLGVQTLEPNFATAVTNLKSQRQQYPLFMSQYSTLVDFQNGVMWNDMMYDKVKYDAASSAADSYALQVILPDGSVQVYDDWRLPTCGEFLSLQNRGKYCPTYASDVPVNSHDSYPDTGQATAGLPSLGFQNVAEALKNSMNDNGKNGDMWMSYITWDYNNDTVIYSPKWEFRLNHAKPIDYLSYESSSSDEDVYLLCRGFGPDTIVNPTEDQNQSFKPKYGQFGKAFTAAECAQYGVATSMTLATKAAPATITYPDPDDNTKTDTFDVPANSLMAVATVTYTINIGGSFKMGYGHTGSFSNAAHSYPGTVSTTDSSTGNPNLIGDLINWSSSDEKSLRMLNLPYVSGIAIPMKTGQVTIHASLLGAGNTAVTASLPVTPAQVSPHTLTSLCISPRNQIYGATQTQPPSGTYPYYCTGFYADGTMETHALDVTWTVPPNEANAQIVPNASGVSLSLNQPAHSSAYSYELTITASYGGLTDSTLIQIVAPIAP